jgi:hypothetical protein
MPHVGTGHAVTAPSQLIEVPSLTVQLVLPSQWIVEPLLHWVNAVQYGSDRLPRSSCAVSPWDAPHPRNSNPPIKTTATFFMASSWFIEHGGTLLV